MRNKNGRIVLDRCEICQAKLSDEEKEKYGHECNECVDHLKGMLNNIGKSLKGGGGIE